MASPPSASSTDAQKVTLPSISSFTQGIPEKESPSSHPPPAFDPLRDSGNWSMSVQSKHSSTVSSNAGLHLHTILNNGDHDNNRFSTGSGGTPASTRFPSGTGPNVTLPALSQPFATNAPQHRDSVDASSISFLDSRRSSVDSRMRDHMNHLALGNGPMGPGSPYESQNGSQTSLVSNLNSQRGIHTPIQPKVPGPVGLSPGARRIPSARGLGPQPPRRVAPPIMSNPRAGDVPNPMASTPTKGYAWAFPDQPEKDEDGSDSPDSSRQSSMHAMDAAARFSQEHGMVGTGSYSRTPELRVSHKLAERKRRSEMKDLFDSLNRILPNSPGNKSSKWEILSKAIEYIGSLKDYTDGYRRENAKLTAELANARNAIDENNVMSNEITAMYQQLLRVDPNGHHVFGPKTQMLEEQSKSSSTQRLPPMHTPAASNGWTQASSGAMQGVEYNNHSAYDRR